MSQVPALFLSMGLWCVLFWDVMLHQKVFT